MRKHRNRQMYPLVNPFANSAQTWRNDLQMRELMAIDMFATGQATTHEWRNHAKLFKLEPILADYKKHGTAGKISAEMLSIRQKGERIAWGMDTDSADSTITIANPRSFD